MSEKLQYSKAIENRVRKYIKDGVGINVIFDSIQDLQNAPKSMQTFYKHYGHVIREERAALQSYLGSKAMERIEEGSDRILELALKSKGGWSPTESVEVKDADSPDEHKSALSTLMRKLGKDTDEDDE